MVCFLSHGHSILKVFNTVNNLSKASLGVCFAGGGVCDIKIVLKIFGTETIVKVMCFYINERNNSYE
jgi:hypothetical protein